MEKKVLLVDDEDLSAEALAERLRDSQFRVEVLHSTDSTISLLDKRAKEFGVAIIDILMPPGSQFTPQVTHGGYRTGLALARLIRDKYPSIALIGLSIAEEPEVTRWFSEHGFAFYRKPVLVSDLTESVAKALASEKPTRKPRMFIIHGHDTHSKLELKNYLQNSLHLGEPIILHEQSSQGRTIIEKFLDNAEGVDLVFALLTPDDCVASISDSDEEKRKARQNVIFELGYFYGRLGRRQGKVLLLCKDGIELPSDIAGMIYIDISAGIAAAGETLRKELARWL